MKPVIAKALAEVQRQITAAAVASGRKASEVTLVAVSKTHEVAAIAEALAAGQRVFGENRVQEAQEKFSGLKIAHPDLKLHLIGALQTNKVKSAVALFDVLETLDRENLAVALASAMSLAGRRPSCFIQINTGEEPQKAGILPREAAGFIERARNVHKLPVTGLMCLPPQAGDPAEHFAFLRELAQKTGLTRLSMGMSRDFATGIRFGATHVRIGSAIFGQRES